MYLDICAIFKTNDFVKMNIFAIEHILIDMEYLHHLVM